MTESRGKQLKRAASIEANPDIDSILESRLKRLTTARNEVAKVFIGQHEIVEELFISLLCGGHTLLEGAPGLGKTLLVQTLGEACGLSFSRLQFTPDLMPADITGTIVLIHDETGQGVSRFQRGPLFAQMVLADEINRATPKTQSALLEAMQERTVTVAGQRHELPAPFFVLATQNPIEMEGTYILPEAQIDRFFFKVHVPYPQVDVLDGILDLTTGSDIADVEAVLGPSDILDVQEMVRQVPVASHVRRAVARFLMATQPNDERASPEVRRFVRYGVSPRGGQTMLLAAKARALMQKRFNVSFADLKAVALPSLRHRFQPNFEAEAEGVSTEDLLTHLLEQHLE